MIATDGAPSWTPKFERMGTSVLPNASKSS
jgi:hypothetical protein